ncbi:metal-dependent hydrolase [Halorubellus sp. PRR65]|uniref:metal-dependent hydrolase n=1 Tax=Halorubellus sp. PRR65 TaxID=3098148 RepID=UPI002B261BE4|nr:metal-dependent hydrolase [Halorubellus sp. PRR65]
MNKKGHLINGALLGIGLPFITAPLGDQASVQADLLTLGIEIAKFFPPIVLGALLPDIDTEFGKHRKTLHNLPLLAVAILYARQFGNLEFVWIGIATHYVLDVLGSKRGIALFYPFSSNETGFPIGVTTTSDWADLMTVVITAFELAVFALFALVIFPNFDFQLSAVEQAIGTLR